jgi:hypothetical protein
MECALRRMVKGSGFSVSSTRFASFDFSWIWNSLPVYMFGCSAAYIPETDKVLIAYGQAGEYLLDIASGEFQVMNEYFGGFYDDFGAGSVFYDDKLWLASPRFNASSLRTVSSDGMSWNEMANNHNGSAWNDMIQISDVLFTLGGSVYDERSKSVAHINQYDVAADEWTVLEATLPISLKGPSAAILGPSLYLFGGLSFEEATKELNDKFWVVKCVNPSACEFGCDATTGQCNTAAAPTTPAPVANNGPTSSNTPQAKNSTAFVNSLSLASILVSLISCLVLA